MFKTDAYRVDRIAQLAKQLLAMIDDAPITREEILTDTHTQWLITTPLYQIGEQAYCLSVEFKEAHPEIDWDGMAGLRHRLVHDYEGTNWEVIADVIDTDVRELPRLIEALVSKGRGI